MNLLIAIYLVIGAIWAVKSHSMVCRMNPTLNQLPLYLVLLVGTLEMILWPLGMSIAFLMLRRMKQTGR